MPRSILEITQTLTPQALKPNWIEDVAIYAWNNPTDLAGIKTVFLSQFPSLQGVTDEEVDYYLAEVMDDTTSARTDPSFVREEDDDEDLLH